MFAARWVRTCMPRVAGALRTWIFSGFGACAFLASDSVEAATHCKKMYRSAVMYQSLFKIDGSESLQRQSHLAHQQALPQQLFLTTTFQRPQRFPVHSCSAVRQRLRCPTAEAAIGGQSSRIDWQPRRQSLARQAWMQFVKRDPRQVLCTLARHAEADN